MQDQLDWLTETARAALAAPLVALLKIERALTSTARRDHADCEDLKDEWFAGYFEQEARKKREA